MTNLTRIDLGDGAYECVSPLVLKYRDIKPVETPKPAPVHMNSYKAQRRYKAVHKALEASVRRS